MAASPDTPRKRRYEPSPAGPDTATVTPPMLRALSHLARCPLLATPQLALLLGTSEKRCRVQLRRLQDAGLVRAVAVTRAALADAGSDAGPELLYGSAPKLWQPATAGLKLLAGLGLVDAAEARPDLPAFGPANALFAGHELAVGDWYVAAVLAARKSGGDAALWQWRQGQQAAVALDAPGAPREVRPDARFVLRVGGGDPPPVLVAFVEADRGTEKGRLRWEQKAAAYGALFAGGRLLAATGYKNARLLVSVPTAARRDRIARIVAETSPIVAARCWLVEQDALAAGLDACAWRRAVDPADAPLRSLFGPEAGP